MIFNHFTGIIYNMIAKNLFKNPILIIGILMMTIFLFNLKKKGYFGENKLIPSSCKSVLVMLNKRSPSTWRTECSNNNLSVEVYKNPDFKKLNTVLKQRAYLYRELANDLSFIAKNSLNESLERVLIVRVKIISKNLDINSITEGRFLAKLATLKDKRFIANHLKATVKVKELIK